MASGAILFQSLGFEARHVLVNGAPGVVTFANGQPVAVVGFTVARGKIAEMNILADPVRLRGLDLTAVVP